MKPLRPQTRSLPRDNERALDLTIEVVEGDDLDANDIDAIARMVALWLMDEDRKKDQEGTAIH